MKTLTIKSPAVECKIQPKFWVALLGVVALGLIYFVFRRKRRLNAEARRARREAARELEDVSEPVDVARKPFEFPVGVRLPALSFHPAWEIIPLLPEREVPLAYRIFNRTGKAPVEVELKTQGEKVFWWVKAEGLKPVKVPLEDAVQLRAVIASFLQQVSPVSDEEE